MLAATAAAADAAATMIANEVNADHPPSSVGRPVALDPDSDLHELPVTVAVGALPPRSSTRRSIADWRKRGGLGCAA